MLDNCTIEERWSGVNELIDRWLQERQAIIVQFCALSGVHDLSTNADPSNIRLQHFCQLLVDYLSAGHFEVYFQLMREAEDFDDGSADTAKSLIAKITATTEVAMGFNDRYVDAEGSMESLPKSLSTLGETLASRFELEDQLISCTHEAHRVEVA